MQQLTPVKAVSNIFRYPLFVAKRRGFIRASTPFLIFLIFLINTIFYYKYSWNYKLFTIFVPTK